MASVNTDTDIDAAWEANVKQRKQDDLNEIITSENLKADETSKFVENAFRDGAIRTTGRRKRRLPDSGVCVSRKSASIHNEGLDEAAGSKNVGLSVIFRIFTL